MVAPRLYGAFCTVRAFIAGRYKLEEELAFSKVRLECRGCFVVKDNVANGMAEVSEEGEGRGISKDIGFSRAVAEKFDVYIIFIYEYEKVLETVDGWFRIATRSIDVDSLPAVKCPDM